MWKKWRQILTNGTIPIGEQLDFISRWLIATRGCYLSLTVTSVLIGGLFALKDVASFNGWNFLLALIGLILAHAANNLMSDYFDHKQGVNTELQSQPGYIHPLEAGIISVSQLWTAVIVMVLIDLAIVAYFSLVISPWVWLLAVVGILLSIFYGAPPIRYKNRGYGELATFIVWGPLMTGGVFYITAGYFKWDVLWLTIPYGLIAAIVLLAKNLDRAEMDKSQGVKSLAVSLGHNGTAYMVKLVTLIFLAFSIVLYSLGLVGPSIILIWLAVPRMLETIKIIEKDKPAQPPAGYSIWPLWFVGWTLKMAKTAGVLLVMGIVLDLLYIYFT